RTAVRHGVAHSHSARHGPQGPSGCPGPSATRGRAPSRTECANGGRPTRRVGKEAATGAHGVGTETRCASCEPDTRTDRVANTDAKSPRSVRDRKSTRLNS